MNQNLTEIVFILDRLRNERELSPAELYKIDEVNALLFAISIEPLSRE